MVYFHVTKDAQKKLELTTELGIFVGYINTPHKYQVYLSANRMTMVCRDVIFDENQTYKKSKDIPIDSHDEEVAIFEEEEVHHENSTTNDEEEGQSEPIQ